MCARVGAARKRLVENVRDYTRWFEKKGAKYPACMHLLHGALNTFFADTGLADLL